VFLLLQLKCAHLVPAKAPLPEEAIFNQKGRDGEEARSAQGATQEVPDRQA
jgi:hypothetical protein